MMRQAEVYRIAFGKEKELADRALKLAEVGKPERGDIGANAT
jgi:hypothetical protein